MPQPEAPLSYEELKALAEKLAKEKENQSTEGK